MAALCLIATMVTSHAASIFVGNHSFEDIDLDGNPNDLGGTGRDTVNETEFDAAISPWTQEDVTWNNTRVIDLSTTNPNLNIITGVNGDQYIVMPNHGGFTLSQTLATTLVADTDYQVTAAFASAFTSPTSSLGDLVEGTISLYADYGGANQVQIATITAGWDDLNNHHRAFQDYSATGSVAGGDAAIGSALTLVLSGFSDRDGSNNSGILADNIRLTAIPEPSSLALLGLVALVVMGRRSRS